MFAYEFETVVKDGIIEIPRDISERVNSRIKVIVFPVQQKCVRKSETFPKLELSTKEFKFSRDEANEC